MAGNQAHDLGLCNRQLAVLKCESGRRWRSPCTAAAGTEIYVKQRWTEANPIVSLLWMLSDSSWMSVMYICRWVPRSEPV